MGPPISDGKEAYAWQNDVVPFDSWVIVVSTRAIPRVDELFRPLITVRYKAMYLAIAIARQ